MATDTRERLISISHDLFYRDGFHAVGLDRILNEVGVTKTTFYNHFQSKDELVLAALEKHDKWWRDFFARKLREKGGDTARGQLAAVFDVIEELIASESFNGCIFVNVAVEFPIQHDPAHVAAIEHKKKMEEILRELAAYAGASDPRALAQELSLLMEGAYVTRQVNPRQPTSQTVRRIAQLVLDKYLPSQPA